MQVILPLEMTVAPVIDLEGTDIGLQVNQALGCMHASLGYTEEQRARLILNQYIVSGAALCRLKVTKTCPSKVIATLLSVMGLEEDIKVASAARLMLGKIWESAVPSDGEKKEGDAIVLEELVGKGAGEVLGRRSVVGVLLTTMWRMCCPVLLHTAMFPVSVRGMERSALPSFIREAASIT